MRQLTLVPTDEVWFEVSESNLLAREMADRHYSRVHVGSKYFVGPGERLILMTYDLKALFVWRKQKYRQDGQWGVECSLFRNEGSTLGKSSELILEAEKKALEKWSDTKRFYTYVNPNKVNSSYPGYSFKKAGWRCVGTSKGGLLLYVKYIEPTLFDKVYIQ